MSNTWKRGLFRLWIVGAVCWIGYVGYPKYIKLQNYENFCDTLARENSQYSIPRYDINKCNALEEVTRRQQF